MNKAMNEVLVIGNDNWLWSEVEAVWSWLYPDEFHELNAHSWREVPKHTKFCLRLNPKSRWLRLIQEEPKLKADHSCRAEGCMESSASRAGGSRGLCKLHYERFRRNGDLEAKPIGRPSNETRVCSNGDCGGVHYAKGLCHPCYKKDRWKNREVAA